MELETACLRLRRFRQEDQESCLRNWAADEAVYQHISRMPMTPGEPEDFLAGADGAYASPATYYWAIEQRDTQNVIGEIFVDDFSERNGWCEVDYKLGTAYWGRGYAAEALGAAAAYLLEQVGFHRVQAKCSVRNAASERVMQKAGMDREGILREFFRRKDGTGYDDVVIYARCAGQGGSRACLP
ncbi:MAG: GNAT family N-acetyltransferase [Oscillospiraceae bacterium]|nr:GNAT family N-acetyltransferase [Oscillospiraceae bacterium]